MLQRYGFIEQQNCLLFYSIFAVLFNLRENMLGSYDKRQISLWHYSQGHFPPLTTCSNPRNTGRDWLLRRYLFFLSLGRIWHSINNKQNALQNRHRYFLRVYFSRINFIRYRVTNVTPTAITIVANKMPTLLRSGTINAHQNARTLSNSLSFPSAIFCITMM